jgi:hypothetical protein
MAQFMNKKRRVPVPATIVVRIVTQGIIVVPVPGLNRNPNGSRRVSYLSDYAQRRDAAAA